MRLIPPTTNGTIEFFNSRAERWAERAAEIGTTPGAVAAVAATLADAKAKRLAAAEAQSRARSATADLKLALGALRRAGAGVVRQVRARAAADGDGVYALAGLPAPAEGSPLPAPGLPTGFTAALRDDGTLQLAWRCANPKGSQGTVYQVSRQAGGPEGAFVTIGVVGRKSFLDTTLPAGVATVTYQVVAVRSTATGEPAQFTVRFGVRGGAGGAAVRIQTGAAQRTA